MALPKIDKPLFEMVIPSQDKTVKFRPFLVKEEKILLMAQQSGAEKEIVLAIKQILQNCIAEDNFDVDQLATFDLEYMFIKLRARSVNNIVKLSYEDLEDKKTYDFEVDLDDIEVTKNPDHTNKIKINDEIGIIMKYPSITLVDSVPDTNDPLVVVDHLIKSCIDKIYDSEEIYLVSEQPPEELNDFIDNLDVQTYDKIRLFFDTLPRMKYEIKYTNSNGNERVIELNKLSDFFTLG